MIIRLVEAAEVPLPGSGTFILEIVPETLLDSFELGKVASCMSNNHLRFTEIALGTPYIMLPTFDCRSEEDKA